MPWVWQYFPTFRMPRAAVNEYLKAKFGDYEFYIDKQNDDSWKFWVPRALTEEEMGELADLRLEKYKDRPAKAGPHARLLQHKEEPPIRPTNQIDDILKHINSLRVPAAKSDSASQDTFFTPRHKLAKELNREMIKKLLKYHGVRGANCDTVHNEYLAVFCTLISIGKIKHIAHFTRDPEFADRRLPFLSDAEWPPQCSSFFKDFEIVQWEFCAQEFHIGRLVNIHLRPNKVIPIIARMTMQTGPGFIVEKIEIHPDYNYLNTASTNATPTNTFVLKSYEAGHTTLYYDEINAYYKLEQLDIAGNTVRIYGSWKQNQTHSVLLEFGNEGTLADLFCSSHPTTSQGRLSFWRNIVLMVESMARIHRHTDPNDSTRMVEGVHQDIKPANILVVKCDTDSSFNYTFKLMDVGLAYFSTSDEKRRKFRKINGRGAQTYSAPECFRNKRGFFDEHSHCDAYPSEDIWSLGCVFSLALVWSVLGPDKLKTYQESLVYSTNRIPDMRDSVYVGCFHDGAKALEEVHSMHAQVMRACGTSDFIIYELIDIVVDMLEKDPRKRPSAIIVLKRWHKALDRATKLSASEANNFPLAFSTGAEATAQHMPQEVPHTSDYHSLDIKGSYQTLFQPPESPVATWSSTRNLTSPSRGSESLYSGQNSVDTVLENRSRTFDSRRYKELSKGKGISVSPLYLDSTKQNHYTDRQLHNYWDSVSDDNQRRDDQGPSATIDEVHSYIQKGKNGGSVEPTLDELRRLPSLRNRDQIFLIDNSSSMQEHWLQVLKAFEVLAYLVKDADPDRVELYFTNSDLSSQHKSRPKLLRLLQSVQTKGQGGMELSLSRILDRCIRPGLLNPMLGRIKRGSNIYVLTDGIWNGEDETLCGIDEAIMRIAANMTTRNSIGIQFIQFGDNQIGTRRLQLLDDRLGQKNTMAIIDHTHVEDNVFKMLLGSIESYWNNQPSVTDELQRTSRGSAYSNKVNRLHHLKFTHLVEQVEKERNGMAKKIVVTLDWELPDVVKSTLAPREQRATVSKWDPATHVVLFTDSSNHGNATATTCTEYITKTWPACSKYLLKLLNKLMMLIPDASSDDEAILVSIIPNSTGGLLDFHEKHIRFSLRDAKELREAADLIEAWHWLAQAVRRPATQMMFSVSSVVYILDLSESHRPRYSSRSAGKLADEVHGKLTTAPATELGFSCWQALFQTCTLLQSKSALQNSPGKGLEARFDLLLSLAAAEFCIIINGGVVFVGYRTLIYPTAIGQGWAQFHLLTCDAGQINPYSLECNDRVLTENWHQFKTMRCYLGWSNSARINLGTEGLLSSTISYTGAPENEKSLQPAGYTALFQAGVPSPFTFIGGMERTFRYESHVVRFTPIDNYHRLLDEAAKVPVMLYDASEKRCWLIPKLSLMLHMSQAYADYCSGIPHGQIPFVPPHSDALELIPFLGPISENCIHGQGDGAFLFRQLMLGLGVNLQSTRQATKLSKKKTLYGFEFMDIITQPGRGSCMKEISLQPAGKVWYELANAVDAVVVCSGVGDAISTVAGSIQCSTLPKGCDYLAATTNILETLATRQGACLNYGIGIGQIKLWRNLFWEPHTDTFKQCDHRDNSKGDCWRKKEMWQHLSSPGNVDKVFELFASPQLVSPATTPIPKSGAVAFGRKCNI